MHPAGPCSVLPLTSYWRCLLFHLWSTIPMLKYGEMRCQGFKGVFYFISEVQYRCWNMVKYEMSGFQRCLLLHLWSAIPMLKHGEIWDVRVSKVFVTSSLKHNADAETWSNMRCQGLKGVCFFISEAQYRYWNMVKYEMSGFQRCLLLYLWSTIPMLKHGKIWDVRVWKIRLSDMKLIYEIIEMSGFQTYEERNIFYWKYILRWYMRCGIISSVLKEL